MGSKNSCLDFKGHDTPLAPSLSVLALLCSRQLVLEVSGQCLVHKRASPLLPTTVIDRREFSPVDYLFPHIYFFTLHAVDNLVFHSYVSFAKPFKDTYEHSGVPALSSLFPRLQECPCPPFLKQDVLVCNPRGLSSVSYPTAAGFVRCAGTTGVVISMSSGTASMGAIKSIHCTDILIKHKAWVL